MDIVPKVSCTEMARNYYLLEQHMLLSHHKYMTTPGAYPEIWIRGGVKVWGLLPFPSPSTTLPPLTFFVFCVIGEYL